MKTVFSNSELTHIFASQTQQSGRSANGNFYFEGSTLYSYGKHFPVARFHGGAVYFTDDSYSVSTSKHVCLARQALHHLNLVYVPNLHAFCELLDISGGGLGQYETQRLEKHVAAYVKERARDIKAISEKLNRMRSEWRKADAQSQIDTHTYAASIAWGEILGKKGDALAGASKAIDKENKARANAAYDQFVDKFTPAFFEGVKESCNSYTQDCSTLKTTHDARMLSREVGNVLERGVSIYFEAVTHELAKLSKAKRKKVESVNKQWGKVYHSHYEPLNRLLSDKSTELYEAENAKKIEAFYGLSGNAYLGNQGTTICRVKEGQVETSQGAKVPLADAERLFIAAASCRKHSRAVDSSGEKVGAYRLTSIDACGNATIGCHYLTWDKMEYCAKRYAAELSQYARAALAKCSVTV